MSSYIAFDLDALNRAPAAARAAGVAEEMVITGLVRMWAWCFREATDSVSALQVRGHFGSDCAEALAAFGFLEKQDGAYRVKGADRYLRVTAGRSKGGKAAAGNLRRGSRQPAPADSRLTPGLSPAEPPADSRPFTDDRTPTTEHRRPKEEGSAASPLADAPFPVDHLRDIWNTNKAPEQPDWRKPKGNDPRAKHAKARWGERSSSEWVAITQRIAASSFCRGVNDRGWRANPDWFLKPGTAAKVLEGTYDDRLNPNNRAPIAAESVDWTRATPGEVAL